MKKNLTPIVAGVAVFLFNAPVPAQAQQADDGMRTVITTGISASIRPTNPAGQSAAAPLFAVQPDIRPVFLQLAPQG